MSAKPKHYGLQIAGLALAMGLIVGAITVYGTLDPSGNGKDTVETAACAAGEAVQASLKAATTGDLAAMRIADKPIPLNEIGFERADGKKTSLADWNGKVVLLNIWATWCGPCREEMPDLAKLQEEYGSDAFEVLALNVDRNGGDKPKAFLESIGATSLGLYLDPANEAFQNLRSKGLVYGLPTTMILDGGGCVQGVLSGIADWISDDARNLVDVATKELRQKS